jgi:hypothetical protein
MSLGWQTPQRHRVAYNLPICILFSLGSSNTSWLAVNPGGNVHTLNETTGDLCSGYSSRTNIGPSLTDV